MTRIASSASEPHHCAHCIGSVASLVDELRHYMQLDGTPSDIARREILSHAFASFPACQTAIGRARSFDEAVMSALRWEAKMIALLPTRSPGPCVALPPPS